MELLTYRDYAALPDDGHRYELWEGRLRRLTSPGIRHQIVSGNLMIPLARHVTERGLGEVLPGPLDVILSDTTVLQPDFLFVARDRSSVLQEHAIVGAPSLVVEVLTPPTAADDREAKSALYARHGVPFLWLVDSQTAKFEVFELRAGRYELVQSAVGPMSIVPRPFQDFTVIPERLLKGVSNIGHSRTPDESGTETSGMSRVALTYRDYATRPDDGRRYELWEGELRPMTSPGIRHQRIVFKLARILADHVEARGLGEVLCAPLDVLLSEITVFQPDVMFIGFQRSDATRADRGIEGAPTLAIEVLSPSTAAEDRGRKRDLYARYGVPYYWIVDGDVEVVEAYVLEGEAYRLVASVSGREPANLAPLSDLDLIPAVLFPPR